MVRLTKLTASGFLANSIALISLGIFFFGFSQRTSFAEEYHFKFSDKQASPQTKTNKNKKPKINSISKPESESHLPVLKHWRVSGGLTFTLPNVDFSPLIQGTYFFSKNIGISAFFPGPWGVQAEYLIFHEKVIGQSILSGGPTLGVLGLSSFSRRTVLMSAHIGGTVSLALNDHWGALLDFRMLLKSISSDSFLTTISAFVRF